DRRLMGRARVVFSRWARGECNLRVGEALHAGALLFQEAGNAEVARVLEDRREYVAYDDASLERLLDRYLGDEAARAAVAGAGRLKAGRFRSDALWAEALAEVRDAREDVERRRAARTPPRGRGGLLLRSRPP